MKTGRLLLVALPLACPLSLFAQQPPSYAQQVRPFLDAYCVECHRGKGGKGKLDLSTYSGMLKGGVSFDAVVPGKPEESYMVLMTERKKKPHMPPKEAKKQPKMEEVPLLRAWVVAGAKDDSGKKTGAAPAKPTPAVTALAYRPDGKLLAAGSQGEVALIDPATGELLGRLADQPGKVTALAFSKTGDTLAVAVGWPGKPGEIRLYHVLAGGLPQGKPARVIPAHKDLIYGTALSPDGSLLASGGYDRLIVLWDVKTGKQVRALQDHSDSVYSLAFHPDGKLLASAAADRAVKVWDVASGRRLFTLGDATDWLYALAWSPDGQRLAAAGVDKSIRVWEVSVEGGSLIQSVFAHEGPITRLVYAADGKTLYSLGEDRAIKSWDTANLTERRAYPKQPETTLALALRPDQKQLAVGRFDGAALLLEEATGKVQAEPLPAKNKPPSPEQEPNDSPGAGQAIELPATVAGALNRAGDVDFYRFEVKAGHQVGVQATAAAGGKLEPVLRLLDADGRTLAESGTGLLGHTFDRAGAYALGIHDRDYRGGAEMAYRLKIGELPVVTALFPLGLQRGTEADIRVEGVNLGKTHSVRVKAAADAVAGSRLTVPIAAPAGPTLGAPQLVVGEFPEVIASTQMTALPVPGTANGRIDAPGKTDIWRFKARKGERLIVEVHARRLGSPLDSVIDVLDAQGRPVPRAVLRCLAKTYTTFRDHDSASPGIRIEAWNELAINDYLWVGNELVRIRALPKNPDDDCQFFAAAGLRLGFLDTTPARHSLGTPMYKVGIHPPGTTFPPNGLPVIALTCRNDDGGPGHGKDSRLFFDPPADGDYQVAIGDARGQGGPAFGYRLTVRPPRPDFTVTFNPTSPSVWKGGALPITVTANRIDGFDDAIALRLKNLPSGFSTPATTIPAGENSTAFALYANPSAADGASPCKLSARAVIHGKDVMREAAGGLVKAVEPGDIVTTTEQAEVTLKPGQQVRLTARIERRNGFTGRVPLDVRGLPHGVRVLDIGLNGILITEKETTRTFVLFAEPWVQPTEHPFVVLARREGKNTEHAARSVLLKVVR